MSAQILEALDGLTDKALKEGGFLGARRRGDPFKEARGRLVNLLAEVGRGNKKAQIVALDSQLLKEVLTTSDFPLLFADTLDRQMVEAYMNWPAGDWKNYTKLTTVADFRTASRHKGDLGSSTLDQVLEKGEYTPIDVDETEYEITALKYGNQVDFSWETINQTVAR